MLAGSGQPQDCSRGAAVILQDAVRVRCCALSLRAGVRVAAGMELCQRIANEAHEDVLPGDSHDTDMEATKGEFGLGASATTAPGPSLLKTLFAAVACRKIRMQRRLLGLGTAQGQKPTPKSRRYARCQDDDYDE